MTAPMHITSPAPGAILMQAGPWSQTITPADLPGQLRLYTDLRDRGATKGKPGPYHKFYAQRVEAIQGAIKQWGRG
jgi:hypothetical protein